MSESTLPTTERSRLRRKTERGSHDRETVAAILDAGLICHVGFSLDGRPWVFPTTYVRLGEAVYLHGAVGNFALRTLAGGAEVCVTVTLIDGLVLARSAFHHSMNYRSVMLFGVAEAVTDEAEKREALLATVDHMAPGRSADSRTPTPEELRSTLVVRLPITEGSAKIRTGPPIDDEEDMGLPHWAGVLPLSLVPGAPIPDGPGTAPPTPDYVSDWVHRRAAEPR
ncbi:MAG TPA: pyridoxamine 5'-phosphate oxidase family protein [Acidimicrobiales bacterium]|nr:pyridoxamine 5'-phosphate oxidase family protein [Acidimicrobiales bacterium]